MLPNSTTEAPKSSLYRVRRWAKLCTMAVCMALPLCGGWCERYKDQQERNDRMRHFYDSVLRAERMYKDSLARAADKRQFAPTDTAAKAADTARRMGQ